VHKLPRQWAKEKIGALLLDCQGGFACAKRHAVDDGLPHLRPFNIGLNGRLNLNKLVRIPRDRANPVAVGLEPGDILFNNTNSAELVGKSAIVTDRLDASFSNHIDRLRVNKARLLPEWLLLSLRVLHQEGVFERECNRWIGQAGFAASRLCEITISVPPLPEQRRIVAKVDAIFERTREAKRLREKALEDIERLRQSALADAFPAPGSELPSDWRWAQLGEVVDLQKTSLDPRKHPKELFSLYSFAAYDAGQQPESTYGADMGSSKSLVEAGQVLFARLNPRIPRVWLVENGSSVRRVASSEFLPFSPRDSVDPHYLRQSLMSPFFRLQVCPEVLGATGSRQRVSRERVLSCVIPVPPLPEQRRIVEKLDTVLATAREAEEVAKKGVEDLDRLEQSILDRAFRGEL